MVAAAPFVGSILALFYIAHFARSRLTKSALAAWPMLVAALFVGLSSVVTHAFLYAGLVAAALAAGQIRVPYLAGIYEENYAASRRGMLYSWSLMATIMTTIACSYAFGWMLDRDLGNYRLILGITCLACLASGFLTMRIPSLPPRAAGGGNPFRNLALIWKDRLFGYVLFVWFILGFANLWVLPLRIVYVADPGRGLNLSPLAALLLVGVLPEVSRLLFTRLWARMFDRLNFIFLRMAINLFFAAGIFVFFATTDPIVIGIGSLLHGVGNAGGGVAWNLWVTKFAPQGRSHVYMSIHTFLTGVRGWIAPYAGFAFVRGFSMRETAAVSVCLLLAATAMLFPLVRLGGRFGGAAGAEVGRASA